MQPRRGVSMNSGKMINLSIGPQLVSIGPLNEYQRAFQSLVDELTSGPLVQPYTLNEVTLTTDASEKPLVLYQRRMITRLSTYLVTWKRQNRNTATLNGKRLL